MSYLSSLADMPRRLRMYRLAEDAWEAELFPWLRVQAACVLDGHQAWVVIPTQAQAGWIRRRCLENGLALLGVRFLTAGSLRRELSTLLNLGTRALGRESLEFLLRLQALKRSSPEARSVALSPSGCLQALDDLGRAGWTGEETDLGEIPSPVQEWLKHLSQSGAWTPSIDAALLAASQMNGTEALGSMGESKISLLIYGWDAEFFPESTLLQAVSEVAESVCMLVPSPRGSSPDPDMIWVEYLEKTLGVEADICAASEFRSVNESLVERLVRRGEGAGDLVMPLFLAGESGEDQAALVEKQLLLWLKESAGHERIALILPAAGSLSLTLTSRLLKAGLIFHDEVGRPEHPSLDLQLQGALADYYLSHGNVHVFLQLIELWKALAPDAPDPLELRTHLYRCFRSSQTQQMASLLRGLDNNHAPFLQATVRLVHKLGSWPLEESWENLKFRWHEAASLFACTTEKLEPLWSRMDGLMEGMVNGRAFLSYMLGITGSSRHTRDQQANQPFARVVLTTLDQAVHQTWAHVIFLESNEGIWPQRPLENAFLNDPLREQLNRRGTAAHSVMLTSLDRVRIDQRRFLDLLENSSGHVAMAAQSQNSSAPEKPYYPNEWFLQCLLLDEHSTEPVLKKWASLIVSHLSVLAAGNPESPDQGLAEELEHLTALRQSRTDPGRAFDEYFFCYFGADTKPWPVSKLESAVQYPATFALEHLFGAVSIERQHFERSETWIVGTLVHEWVRRRVDAARAGVTADVEADLVKQFWPDQARQSLWWRTVFDLSRWAAESCWQQLQVHLASPDLRTEFPIQGSIATPLGLLRVNGRLDLLARDLPDWPGSRVEIIDFKTGRAQVPSALKLAQGEGLQFGAYLALAMTLGDREATLRCLSPRLMSQRILTHEDLESARQGLALAADLQSSMEFGMSGALHHEHDGSEQLPLATLPVDVDILEKKRKLTSALRHAAGVAKKPV
jgi:hypothetical protein